MQKVRQHRHRHSVKLVKCGPRDKRKEDDAARKLARSGLDDDTHHKSARHVDRSVALVSGHDVNQENTAPHVNQSDAGSRIEAARTVVERLRSDLDHLLEDSTPGKLQGVEARVVATWLPGRPCQLDTTRCLHSLNLLGGNLEFPFVPMGPQVAVAERVIRACEQGGIALLQSPTGTGKSIALLTAALAWQRQAFAQHGAAPQIIYGVRTHVQAKQMVGELRKMPYRPRVAVIGSRDQLCINDDVKALARHRQMSLNNACRQAARRAVQSQTDRQRGPANADCGCAPYAQLGDAMHAQRIFDKCGRQGALWDVEDLVSASRGLGAQAGCPYYSAHVLAGNADIVFLPSQLHLGSCSFWLPFASPRAVVARGPHCHYR
jgi:hypothetical protein